MTLSGTAGSPTLGTPYTLTLTGKASASATAYIYENTGTAQCGAEYAAEQRTSAASQFGSQAVSAGSFTVSSNALAQHTGTKYYCGYLTAPAPEVQIVVKVLSS